MYIFNGNKISNKINLLKKIHLFYLFNKMVYVHKMTITKTYSKAFKVSNEMPSTLYFAMF